jgi:hypothetical protein
MEASFMSTGSLTKQQRQTQAARQAFADRFSTPEAKREHFRTLGQKSAAGRFVLSDEDARTLASVYELLRGIGEKARAKVDAAQSPDESAA